jgi:hypothetical protein
MPQVVREAWVVGPEVASGLGRCVEAHLNAWWSMMAGMSLPGLNPDEYPPIDPNEPMPDDAGELLPDTPDELPDAPVEPLPDDGEEGGVREPA